MSGAWGRVGAAAIFVVMAAALLAIPDASPASAGTFDVTSASCTGPGSLVEAVNKANSTPGADTKDRVLACGESGSAR